MDGMDRATAIRIEKVRMLWATAANESETHRQRYLAMLAASFGAALTFLGSILLEKVSPWPGAAAVLALLGLAGFVHARLSAHPGRLRAATREYLRELDRFLYERGD